MASFTKQTSALKNIPSINDFNSLTHEDLEPYEPEFNVRVPTARPIDRSWSVESNAETPRRMPSSFAETFTRALYEHMRGN